MKLLILLLALAQPPQPWLQWLGEYQNGPERIILLEREGALTLFTKPTGYQILTPTGAATFRLQDGRTLSFTDGPRLDSARLERRQLGPESGNVFRITPVRPVAELRREALAATPPAESPDLLKPDLVALAKLDRTIHLDIRYATSDNFLSTPLYDAPVAKLQRPAAQALLRAHRNLKKQGFGLLIHDAYRPWYVTKIFWDATPPDKHEFVADPAKGSRHNRGCAVDLTLYHLKTGKPAEMVGVYDEMSERSYPDYPGGTTAQRANRAILRKAMEAEGFTVFESEWWHFDYKDWPRYAIGNVALKR